MNEPPPRRDPETPASEERILTEEEVPATLAQLQGLRRWVVVAGVWAVAATAIAVFALVEASKEDEAGREQVTGELGRVQRQLNDRMDELDQRLDELPTSEQVATLEEGLQKVARDTGRVSNRLEAATGRVDEIEGQVSELEEAVQAIETTTAETETTP
jgi:TolA-binding protein